MAITFNRNYYNQIDPPPLVLIKGNGERIGVIPTTEYTYDRQFSDVDSLNFSTPLYMDGEVNPVYDEISNMKFVDMGNGEGRFAIMSVQINSEGTHQETKTVEAKSLEILLGQLYDLFIINTGDVESIDGVKFFNPADVSHSLMHLVLAKATGWSMGHVPSDLYSVQRSFNQERIAIYDFIMNDIAEAFDVHFTFDSYNKRINVYHLDTYGENTNIHVSYNNLLKSTDMQCDTDNIKTCITLKGDDELTVREINLGSENLYNLDYYCTTEFWSEGLVTAYNAWKVKYEQNLPTYNNLLAQYEEKVDQILTEQTNKFPATDNWEQWVNMTESQAKGYMANYSYDHLEEKKKAYEQKQTVMQKSGWGTSGSTYYQSKYVPVYNVIQWCTQVLASKKATITTLTNQQTALMNQMTAIMNVVAMPNNFTQDQLVELTMFIREDELTSDNYIVTDNMTTQEKYDMLEDMLEFGRKELLRVSTPQLSFNADLLNLFSIPEFNEYSGDFDVGNYIYVTLRDDYNIKAKLLSIHYNFLDVSDFTATFGNIVRKEKNVFTDIQDAMNAATSAATSVSFNQSYWSESSQKATDIDKALEEGLTRAGYVLTDGTGTDAVWDERGLFLNTQATRADGTADPNPNDSIFLGGGRILFTQDKWKTVETALGRIPKYTHDDSTGNNTISTPEQGTFGLLAKQVVSGTVWGSTFIGGSIKSSNYKYTSGNFSDQGTLIDLSGSIIRTPKFGVASNGNAYFKGDITGSSGTFSGTVSGATIKGGTISIGGSGSTSAGQNGVLNIYNSSNKLIGRWNSSGLYLYDGNGTAAANIIGQWTPSGISIKKGSISISNAAAGTTFSVDTNGYLSASGASISGTITATGGRIGKLNSAWNIGDKSIYNGCTGIDNTTGGTYVGIDGIRNQNGNSYVRIASGTLKCNNVDIDGGTLDIGANFSVNNTGVLTAKNGNFSGSISSSSMTSSSIDINSRFVVSDQGRVYIKTQGTDHGEDYLVVEDPSGMRTYIGGEYVMSTGASASVKWMDILETVRRLKNFYPS